MKPPYVDPNDERSDYEWEKIRDRINKRILNDEDCGCTYRTLDNGDREWRPCKRHGSATLDSEGRFVLDSEDPPTEDRVSPSGDSPPALEGG